MKLYIFTEESSAEICFKSVLSQAIPSSQSFKIFAHRGREDLKQALRKALPVISREQGAKILITIDQDKHDCKTLKKELQEIIRGNCQCPNKIRIVCKELESWFLGDLAAISKAYPRFKPEKYHNKSEMRNVDEIEQPSKKLIKMLTETNGGKCPSKGELSQRISPHLNVSLNTSTSFQQTIQAIKILTR